MIHKHVTLLPRTEKEKANKASLNQVSFHHLHRGVFHGEETSMEHLLLYLLGPQKQMRFLRGSPSFLLQHKFENINTVTVSLCAGH